MVPISNDFWHPGMSWESDLRSRVKRLGPKTHLNVVPRKGNFLLRYRPPSGASSSRVLPFKWNEHEADDAYIRIRNIYKLMLEGIEFSLAVDIADDKAPLPDEDRDWNKALEEYKIEKLTRGTAIKEGTWLKEHEPVIRDATELMTGRKPPRDPAELINKTTEKWESGSRTRQQRTRNLSAFLRYCVDVQHFPAVWNPPNNLTHFIGRKLATSKSEKVDPITDQEIIGLIDSLENFDGATRDKPAALNWARAIKLMAAFGLRAEELKHLQKKVDKKTNEKYLWCSYQKRAGGGLTQPRKLRELYPIDEKGKEVTWDLVELFDQKSFILPPFQGKTGVGDACLKYLKRKECWKELLKTVEARGERLGTYSFRHSYSVRGHQQDIDGGSMATAMGHSFETHCREYPWATESGTDSAFERARANRMKRKAA